MCDYSLESVSSRPAKVGEKLTAERFYTGSVGFKAPEMKDGAVCLECGMHAMLGGDSVKHLLTEGADTVEGIFAKDAGVVADAFFRHRDGFLINGEFVSLQKLQGVVIEVISTEATEQTIAALKASIVVTESELEPVV